jgi:hypothetical protein
LPELRRGAPDCRVFKEQPWRQQHIRKVLVGIDPKLRRIELEIGYADRGARIVFLTDGNMM